MNQTTFHATFCCFPAVFATNYHDDTALPLLLLVSAYTCLAHIHKEGVYGAP